MATLKQIAEEAGVSVQTVSNVLNGINKENWPSTRERADRIRAIAAKHNFRPNAAARSMRLKRTKHIGAVLQQTGPVVETHNAALLSLIMGAEDCFAQHGYLTSIIRLRSDTGEVSASRIFNETFFDGLLVVGKFQDSSVSRIRKSFQRVVFVEGNHWEDQWCVRRDEVHSGFVAAEDLAKAGLRKIFWLGPMPVEGGHYSVEERLAGVKQCCDKYGCSLSVLPTDTEGNPLLHLLPSGMLDDNCGVVAYNADFALFLRLPHKLPKDIFIPARNIACCDMDWVVGRSWKTLGYIKVNQHEIGHEAAEMLLIQLEELEGSPKSRRLRFPLRRLPSENPEQEAAQHRAAD